MFESLRVEELDAHSPVTLPLLLLLLQLLQYHVETLVIPKDLFMDCQSVMTGNGHRARTLTLGEAGPPPCGEGP